MLSAYITPKIDMATNTYSAGIRFTSEENFTYAKVIVGCSHKTTGIFEKKTIEGFDAEDIHFGPSRAEESFDVDLFNFSKQQNRDFTTLLLIQANNTGEFEDITPYYFFHKYGGKFKTVTNNSLIVTRDSDFHSIFAPELIEEILKNKFDYDITKVSSHLITSNSYYIVSSDGKLIRILDYLGDTISYTAEELEEMIDSLNPSLGPMLGTADGKIFVVSW